MQMQTPDASLLAMQNSLNVRRAMTGKVYDNETKNRTDRENTFVETARLLTLVQVGIMLYMLPFLYQQTITLFTYFVQGGKSRASKT